MKVWKVLGRKNLPFSKDTMLFTGGVVAFVYFVVVRKMGGNFLLIPISFGLASAFAWYVKKNLDYRDDWMKVLYRMFFRPEQSWNMVDRYKDKKDKNDKKSQKSK